MKANISLKTKAALIDPNVDAVMDRLFDGKDSKEFANLVQLYVTWKVAEIEDDTPWLGGHEFLIALDEMLAHAKECVEAQAEEDRRNA